MDKDDLAKVDPEHVVLLIKEIGSKLQTYIEQGAKEAPEELDLAIRVYPLWCEIGAGAIFRTLWTPEVVQLVTSNGNLEEARRVKVLQSQASAAGITAISRFSA